MLLYISNFLCWYNSVLLYKALIPSLLMLFSKPEHFQKLFK